jgi:hypothetical protein
MFPSPSRCPETRFRYDFNFHRADDSKKKAMKLTFIFVREVFGGQGAGMIPVSGGRSACATA